ncbi:ABC transporter substrate-binding protein [Sneathiella sp. HT1-7]|uniref:ABC transporter substrate-binding protein n=1 Tax=Sneathiella sp. HT1-7 TaxID=2887192 RepID=UPI001D13A43F|nr:ABC transporter substrate-binding protein [Sneathiella sp. HT1-7]MCC3305945.1 ABC transporter substrate-binding protein [Sneathiella sp. HT1-7]
MMGKTTNKFATLLGGLLAFSVVSTACGKEPVMTTIGAIYNLTGEQRNLDIPSSQGAELAMDEINASGGILGRPATLLIEDGETNTDVIAKKTATMIAQNPDMPVLIGMSDTDVVLAAAKAAAKDKRIFVTSGATSPLLPQDVPDFLYLACYGDNVQAAAAASFARDELKFTNVAVLYKENMSYTMLLRRYFEESFKDLGGDILFSRGYGPDSFDDAVATLPEADFIYLSASPDQVVDEIRALRNAGVTVPIISGDGFDIGTEWANLPDESNVYFTTHADVSADNTSPSVTAFRSAFKKKFPNVEPDAFSALGYDTVKLVAAAIEAAGSTDVEAIREALSTLTNFKGITGEISFSNDSQIPTKSVTIMKVIKGDETFVQTILPENVPAP